ncbi:MAG: hypothetical protein ACKVOY_15650 [Burkholderiaceae bacterium]|jgi:hypothetical protein|nr:hypothetical protein [Betaproteobacteria bacterium]
MIVEPIDLKRIKPHDNTSTLESMDVGDSIFCDDAKKAQSLRVLSYYLVKSRNLSWKFVFRKMDSGWRVIRVQ